MKRCVLILVWLLGVNLVSNATHIVGGEFEIQHIEGDQYLFRQIQYFDVVNGNPQAKDREIIASIFRKRDNVFIRSVLLPLRSENFVPYTNPVCTNDRLITNRLVYSAEIRLNASLFSDPGGYYLVWERCCRNNIINNIVNPDETGQTFYLEFPAIRRDGIEFRNSSPQLFPPLSDYACVNRFYYVDFRGTDPDGDSLSYSLVAPLNSSTFEPLPTPTPAPHPNVTWVAGINSTFQVPGNPTLDINDKGFLTVVPSEEGLFVFSVRCEEFRNVEKIGEVIRDFQLFVIDCPDPGNPPEIQAKAPGSDIFVAELDTIRLALEDSKCFDFNIVDKDGSETITMRAEPVNFEADLNTILSTDIGYLNIAEDTLGIQVCLPDCPYLQGEPFIIDIIAQDFTCPQPLMDTMRLIVLVEPPPNRPPRFTDPVQSHINTSFLEGTVIDLNFEAEDSDLDSLLLFIENDGFDLAEYGIEIDTLSFEDGKINFQLRWDTDCQVYPFGLKNEFQLKFYVEDADQCGSVDRDSVVVNITIDLPDNNEPVVLIDDEHVNKDLIVRIGDDLIFDVSAFDGDPTDSLTLEAVGIGFDLIGAGFVFETKTGNSNINSDLQWSINCDNVNLGRKDQYEILLITEDADKCKVPNADTIMLTLNVLPPLNFAPEILVNGEPLEDTVFVDAGDFLEMEIAGIDPDGDSISLVFSEEETLRNFGIDFSSGSGIGSVFSTFNWQTDCSLLNEGYQDAIFNINVLLQDFQCIVPMADTLDMVVVIRDENIDYDFLPPNVYTPNADNINESYFVPNLPKSNCERQFESVAIYNRYGIEVFSSKERDFQWYGEGQPSGVYFYLIIYTDFSVKGSLSLLR